MAAQDIRYGMNIDMLGAQIKNHRLEQRTSDPAILNAGSIWYDTLTDTAKVYNGANVKALYADDDDFHSLSSILSTVANNDELLIADADDSYAYKRITRQDLLSGVGTVENAYYRIIAEAGVANLDASGESFIQMAGDGAILKTYGSVTGSNSISIIFHNQYANKVLAGPTSGGTAYPTFRQLVDADMPVGYDPTAWDSAASHVTSTSNPHSVTAAQVGAEDDLGNPGTDGYLLSSTAAGARSWVTPHQIGGQSLNALIVTPTASEDGYSLTWDNTAGEYTLTNVTGGAGGITASGTPVANQIGVWAGAASMLGDPNLTWITANEKVLLGTSGNDSIFLSSDSTLASIYSIREGNSDVHVGEVYSNTASYYSGKTVYRYGGTIASPAIASTDSVILTDQYYVYDGSSTIDAGSVIVSVDGAVATGNFKTQIAFGVRSGAANTVPLTIHPDKILMPEIAGSGTGTSMLYYNRTTGEVSYADAPSGTAYWSRTGTDVSLVNAGDDLLLALSTERIKFGDGDTSIRESTDDVIAFETGGSDRMYLGIYLQSEVDIVPGSTLDLGASVAFWNNCYMNLLYVSDTSTSISVDGSGNLTFDDVQAGTVTLSDLAGAAGVTVGSGDNVGNISVFTNTGEISGYSSLTYSNVSKQLLLAGGAAADYSLRFTGSVNYIAGYDHSEGIIKYMLGTTFNTSTDADVIFYYDPSNSSFVLGTHSKTRQPKLWVYENAIGNAAAYIENVASGGGDVLTARMANASGSYSIFQAIAGSTVHLDVLGNGSIIAPNIEDNYYVEVIRIQYTEDGLSQTIVSLTAGDVAWWQAKLYVTTAFDGTPAAQQLRIGNSAHYDSYYFSPANPGWNATGWFDLSLNNDPDRISGNESITCRYDDSDGSASQGNAYLYMFYSRH
jgi:hypothetical protein